MGMNCWPRLGQGLSLSILQCWNREFEMVEMTLLAPCNTQSSYSIIYSDSTVCLQTQRLFTHNKPHAQQHNNLPAHYQMPTVDFRQAVSALTFLQRQGGIISCGCCFKILLLFKRPHEKAEPNASLTRGLKVLCFASTAYWLIPNLRFQCMCPSHWTRHAVLSRNTCR